MATKPKTRKAPAAKAIAPKSIELLRIHALVRTVPVLIGLAAVADDFSRACRRSAGRLLDDVTAWMDAREAAKSP